MTKIKDLIKKHCPDGAAHRPLGEIGDFYGGLTGKSKEDFKDGNAKFITYMNVFGNLAVNTEIVDMVKIAATERQNIVHFGDVLFTASSETLNECGMSSVLTAEPDEPFYLNSFCFGFRLSDPSLLLPDFSKHLFRSDAIRKQIVKTANGVTRFNVSKEKMRKVRIPLPPLIVQQEIVRILDLFTELTTELTTELGLRKKQYEYYRNSLLTFKKGDKGVRWVKLGEIGQISAGGDVPKDRFSKEKTAQYNVPIWSNGIGENALYGYTEAAKIFDSCITIAARGTIGYCALRTEPFYPIIRLICIVPNTEIITADYLKYSVQMLNFIVPASGIPQLTVPMVSKYEIPLPSLSEQKRIVSILDKFEELTVDLSKGIPAEIAMRKKQYEYYRNKLLTFEEIDV
jgi:type I restriction enzyme S subunit